VTVETDIACDLDDGQPHQPNICSKSTKDVTVSNDNDNKFTTRLSVLSYSIIIS